MKTSIYIDLLTRLHKEVKRKSMMVLLAEIYTQNITERANDHLRKSNSVHVHKKKVQD